MQASFAILPAQVPQTPSTNPEAPVGAKRILSIQTFPENLDAIDRSVAASRHRSTQYWAVLTLTLVISAITQSGQSSVISVGIDLILDGGRDLPVRHRFDRDGTQHKKPFRPLGGVSGEGLSPNNQARAASQPSLIVWRQNYTIGWVIHHLLVYLEKASFANG